MMLEVGSLAHRIGNFGPLVVSGCLQVPNYQHEPLAVIPGLATSTAQRLADLRTARQIETIGRAEFQVNLGAETLTRQVRGAAEMQRKYSGKLPDCRT